MRYWLRWLLPPPLTAGPVYRMSEAGRFQTWRSGQWVTIEAFDTQADTMLDEISRTRPSWATAGLNARMTARAARATLPSL